MKLVWGNSFDSANNYRAYEKKQREAPTAGNMAVGTVFGNNNLAKQKMEERLRKAEDKLLEGYRQQIAEIQSSEDSNDTKKIKISVVNEQIKQIEDARKQRELDAMTAELEKQKAEAEEQKKAAEKKNAAESEEDSDIGIKREDIEGMVKLSVSNESIRELKRTKATLNSEAKQLEMDINNDFGLTKYGAIKTSHATFNDFKHRQYNKLNVGMSRLESSIASEVSKIADAVSDIAKEKSKVEMPSNKEEAKEEEVKKQEENKTV